MFDRLYLYIVIYLNNIDLNMNSKNLVSGTRFNIIPANRPDRCVSRTVNIIFLIFFIFIFIPSSYACRYCTSPENCVNDQWRHLSYGDVKIGGEIGRRIDLTINGNIKCLNLENDFMKPFVTKKDNGGFIGIGMFLDAAARLAAYSGDNEMLAIKNRIVDLLISHQEDDGYIGFLRADSRLWNAWDVHEMVYIITGLLSDYTFFGQERSLNAAIRTADYILDRWSGRPVTFGDFYLLGIDKAMLALYKVTGEERFRDFGENKKSLTWTPGIEKGRTPGMYGHIFAYLAINEAQLDLYRLTDNDRLFKATDDAITHLVEHDGLSVIGGAGQEECWTDDQDGEGDHAETCATAYMIRIYDNLLRLRGQSSYGDLIERSLYNALFAAQSSDGRKIRYYTPFEGERKYFHMDLFCCPNNFRRIISEIPLMIYYTKLEGGIAVNLYTSSSAVTTFDDGVKLNIRQTTDYPTSGHVVVSMNISRSKAFPLALRIPKYAENVSVTVNGVRVEEKVTAGEFFVINRQWNDGDRVELDIPMEFRLVAGRKRQSGRVAVMRGPLVYCLSRVTNPVVKDKTIPLIGKITLDPTSLSLVADTTVRRDGTACMLKAWNPGFGFNAGKSDYNLKLTEFADAEGVVTYFRIPEYTTVGVVEDELIKF
jgi:DUF1680 family protein